ncbi:unnamed protein product, partial [Trichobilharzia szidati]
HLKGKLLTVTSLFSHASKQYKLNFTFRILIGRVTHTNSSILTIFLSYLGLLEFN